jgi:dephospho-CoA kinase
MSRRPVRVALTGGIATGKSRCVAACVAAGIPVIDADIVAREVVAPGTPGLHAIRTHFGEAVIGPDGLLDRGALGARIFSDVDARRTLEAIVHPAVYACIEAWFTHLEAPVGLADVPLLFETGRAKEFDVVVVAACRPDQQLARLMARNGLSAVEAQQRIDAQWPLAEKVARAHYVIDTSGTLEETDQRAAAVAAAISRAD